MDRVEHAFFHPSQFTNEIGWGEYGPVTSDQKGIMAMKARSYQHVAKKPKAGEIGSLSREMKTLNYFSSICPEFVAAPGVIARVPTDDEKKRSIDTVQLHASSPHEYLIGDTSLFIPKVRNASTLHQIIHTGQCSEYDALVGSMQLWLMFLCVGDSVELNDLHVENIMFSPSISFFNMEDGNLMEKSPQVTFIDTEYYHIGSVESHNNHQPFRENMVSISQLIYQVLQMCRRFKQIKQHQLLKDQSSYFKVFPSNSNRQDPPLDGLRNYFQVFKDNILDPLSRDIDAIEKVPNIYHPTIHGNHTPRLEHFAEYAQNPNATEAWKQNRRKVIRDLRVRIDFLVNHRILQLHMGEYLKEYPTWKLDSRLEKDEHRAAKRAMH
jgi:hypothetical protein